MMGSITRGIRSYAACQSAVATLEAAVVLPFVLLLGVGIIEFGWVFSQIHGVQNGLRDAVRYVSRTHLVIAAGGGVSLSTSAQNTAYAMLDTTFRSLGITSTERSITLNTISNVNGSQYLGGSKVYSVTGAVSFTPVSAGLLTIFNVTLPVIHLHYEARHVGA